MKDRMSRKHKTRQNYRVDSLLNAVNDRNSLEEEKNGAPNNYMTLLFLGFYNKSMVDEQFVEVEIVVSKIAQMKRKDSFKSKQERVSQLSTAHLESHSNSYAMITNCTLCVVMTVFAAWFSNCQSQSGRYDWKSAGCKCTHGTF